MSKKRILILSNHFRHLYSTRKELVQRLVEEGHEVYISMPIDEENVYFSNLGCHIIETKIDRRGVNPLKDIHLIHSYKDILNRINPDIVFSFTVKPNIYGALAVGNKYKLIANITGTGGAFITENFVSRIIKKLYKLSLKNCFKVYFQNSGDQEFFLKNHLVKGQTELLPGSGCNLDEYRLTSLPSDQIVKFIFIGRVMKLKGIDEYLKAAKQIKAKYSNTIFYVAGWNEEEKYKEIIRDYEEEGVIDYLGFRKDIGNWIKDVHCVVLPSHGGEGVPNVLLESSATGRACIGSNINGTKDVIDHEVTGYLFEPGNTEELVDVLNSFMELSYTQKVEMGLNARKKVEDQFDRKIVTNKYMHELEF